MGLKGFLAGGGRGMAQSSSAALILQLRPPRRDPKTLSRPLSWLGTRRCPQLCSPQRTALLSSSIAAGPSLTPEQLFLPQPAQKDTRLLGFRVWVFFLFVFLVFLGVFCTATFISPLNRMTGQRDITASQDHTRVGRGL